MTQIEEMIKFYQDKIREIDGYYHSTQSHDKNRIDYKVWKSRHVEQKELLEDFVVDLKRLKDKLNLTDEMAEVLKIYAPIRFHENREAVLAKYELLQTKTNDTKTHA